ncbi:transforming growth factor beta regulator 1, partial [Linnemannia exigua]
ENEQMSHELDKFHRRVRNLRREKNLLLDRLCMLERHQSPDSGSDSVSSLSSDSESSDSSLSDESHRATQRTGGVKQGGKGTGNSGGRGSGASQATGETALHHLKKTAPKGGTRRSSPSVTATSPTSARSAPKEPKPQAPAAVPSTITNVGSATQKPKRVHQTNKQRPGLAKARKVQIVERNADGSIKMPVTVGIITILSIGHVVYDREAFHNDRYIWPVGYKMSRSYNSMVDPTTHTTYTCSVIDDGEAPK